MAMPASSASTADAEEASADKKGCFLKVVISGYYGFNNAGDDLILESIISQLRGKQEDIQITVFSARPAQTEQNYSADSVNRWNLFKVFNRILKCDAVISGGGGLFQDFTGSASLYYYLAIICLGKFLGKKLFVYSAGINDLRPVNRKITAYVLGLCDKITVREETSLLLLASWGCDRKKIAVASDPVALIENPAKVLGAGNPRIALILRPAPQTERCAKKFAYIADSLARRLNGEIVLIAFQPEKDINFLRTVKDRIKAKSSLLQWTDFKQSGKILGNPDLVISQRFHGLMLAFIGGIACVGVSDDDKIKRFIDEIGQKNIADFTNADENTVISEIINVWECRGEFRKRALETLPSFRESARKSAEIFFNEVMNGQ